MGQTETCLPSKSVNLSSIDLRYVDAITIIQRPNMTSCSCYYRFFVNICLVDRSLMFLVLSEFLLHVSLHYFIMSFGKY